MATAIAPGRSTLVLRGRLLWPALVFLVAVGASLSVIRVAAILTGWSAFRALDGLFPAPLVADGVFAEQWYASHSRLTLFHVVPGALFLSAIPVQLIECVRRRYPAWHRWIGRTLVAIGVPVALSGLVLGALSPFGGATADTAIFLFGALFLVAIARGFVAARRRQFRVHRQWMLRAAAVAAGIATVRVVALPLYAAVGGSALALTGASFWLGLGLSAAGAEWWLWHTRRTGHDRSVLPN